MSKLYYDDPLVSAYMCREFGVEFNCYTEYEIKAHIEQGVVCEFYFIDDSSLDIFKPKVGDLVRGYDGQCWIVDSPNVPLGIDGIITIKFDSLDTLFGVEGIIPVKSPNADFSKRSDSLQSKSKESIEIIQRNNKPYFMPKRRNNEN